MPCAIVHWPLISSYSSLNEVKRSNPYVLWLQVKKTDEMPAADAAAKTTTPTTTAEEEFREKENEEKMEKELSEAQQQ